LASNPWHVKDQLKLTHYDRAAFFVDTRRRAR